MDMRYLIVGFVLLLGQLAYAQLPGGGPPGGPPGQSTGVQLKGLVGGTANTNIGMCRTFNLRKGTLGTRNAGDECDLVNLSNGVNARDYLNCDGSTDDRAALATLVGSGGAAAGKTLYVPSDCSILLSTPNTGAGGGSAIVLEPDTSIVCEESLQPHFTLARRYCSGGDTPGAGCPGGAGDCPTGSCVYDTGSHAFAHTTGDTYTVIRSVEDADCTGLQTPYAFCTGSGTGVVVFYPTRNHVIGCTIATNQMEPYGRCGNGGSEDGDPCANVCTAGFLIGFGCDTDDDCIAGTCSNSECPGGATGAPLFCLNDATKNPSGDGSINVIDFEGTISSVVNVQVADHHKGAGISTGTNALVENNNLRASQAQGGDGHLWGLFPIGMWDTNDIVVTTGIAVGNNSVVIGNIAIGDTEAIKAAAVGRVERNSTIANNAASAVGINVTNSNTPIIGNTVNGLSGSSAVGIKSANTMNNVDILSNTVTVTGASATGILADAAESAVAYNTITGGSNSSMTGIDANAGQVKVLANHIKSFSGTSSVGVNGTGGQIQVLSNYLGVQTGLTPKGIAFVGGGTGTSVIGNSVNATGDGSVGIDFGTGFSAIAANNLIGCGREGVGVVVTSGQQTLVDANYIGSCTIAVGPPVDNAINYNISNNRIFGAQYAGCLLLTGGKCENNYIAWGTGTCVGTGATEANWTDPGFPCGSDAGAEPDNTCASNDHCTAASTPDACCAGVDIGTCTNEGCVGVDDPWDCCSGADAGTCTVDTCVAGAPVVLGDERRPENWTVTSWNAKGAVCGHCVVSGNLLHQNLTGNPTPAWGDTLVKFPDMGTRCNTGDDVFRACEDSSDCAASAVCDLTYVSGGTDRPTFAQINISTNQFFKASTDYSIDMDTCVDSGSCEIANIMVGSNVSNTENFFDFPDTNIDRVTLVTVGANAFSGSGNYKLNWNPSMGIDVFGLMADFPGAGCDAGTGASVWDVPSSNPAAPACYGSNYPRGVLDFDDATTETAYTSFALADLMNGGTLQANIYWLAAATTGNVEWQLSTACTGDSEATDPSWNTADTVITAVDATTTDLNVSNIYDLDQTGCVEGEVLHLRLQRNPATASDMSGDARLVRVEIFQ